MTGGVGVAEVFLVRLAVRRDDGGPLPSERGADQGFTGAGVEIDELAVNGGEGDDRTIELHPLLAGEPVLEEANEVVRGDGLVPIDGNASGVGTGTAS